MHPALFLRSVIIGFLLAIGVASWIGIPPLQSGVKSKDNVESSRENNVIFREIFSVRDKFTKSLNDLLPYPHSAFVAGTILGKVSNLPRSIKNEFARTSTSHITAVSGYNITIIAVIIGGLFSAIFSRSSAFWLTVFVLFIFMIMTGAQASVVRATIMGLYVLVARQFGRLPSPSHGLLIAGGVMVALEPRILAYDIGFQLSFLATAGIFYIMPLIEYWYPKLTLFGIFGENLMMTISAQIAVLPLLIYYFHSLSLISIPVNLLVLPLIPFVMMGGFVSGIVGIFIPILGKLISAIPLLLSSIVLNIIHYASEISWAAVPYDITWFMAFLSYIVMTTVIIFLHNLMRRDLTGKR